MCYHQPFVMLRPKLLKLARVNPIAARVVLPLLKTSDSLEDSIWAYVASGRNANDVPLPMKPSLATESFVLRNQPVFVGLVHGVQATDPAKISSFTLKKGKGADSFLEAYIVSKSGLSTDPSDPMPGDHVFKDFKAAKRFWEALADEVTKVDDGPDPEYNRWLFCHTLTSVYQQKKGEDLSSFVNRIIPLVNSVR